MTGALIRAAIAATCGTCMLAITIAIRALIHDASMLDLFMTGWYVYVPAIALPTTSVFAFVAFHNWLAAGDPQMQI